MRCRVAQTPAQERYLRVADRCHTGQIRELLLESTIKIIDSSALVPAKRRINAEQQNVTRVETRVDALEVREGVHHKTGPGEHNRGQCDLHDDQSATHVEPLASCMRGAEGTTYALL